ncbi:AAA family ATPase [Flavobacterium sp. LaA7.5]|nr:AAA family ATPase [Flavobacterium salilacus subsp. altitudinum]
MKVKVVSWNSNNIPTTEHSDFILEQDSWNDHLYFTYYYLHSNLLNEDKSYSLIGGVRILKKGQKEREKHLINLGQINSLDNFCSLGASLDYYERISQLNDENKYEVLNFLNDIIQKPSLREEFKNEEGFNKSVLRDINYEDEIFTLAPTIITGKYESLPDKKNLRFTFNSKSLLAEIIFDFSSKEYYNDFIEQKSLPGRICVIVGRNGSGKSTLLSKIARLVFSSTDDRIYIKGLGELKPKGLGFPRIINISYSAFDSFQVPGITISEKNQILQDMEKNVGRYIYCGVRDIVKEVELELQNIKIDKQGKIDIFNILNDKYEYNYLKSISTFKKEFIYALDNIILTEKKCDLLLEVLNLLSEEPSLYFLKEIEKESITILKEDSFFNNLSTGHKFVIHSLFKLIYHIEKLSLVLFDEPESHLHPPLLAILMKALRFILDSQSSFMIITTHSPVVVQETLQKHVIILRREGDLLKTSLPINQSFGESISSITSEIFDLTTNYTDYHIDLDKIVDSYNGDKDNFQKYIMNLFDDKISSQAYAYMMSRYKQSI